MRVEEMQVNTKQPEDSETPLAWFNYASAYFVDAAILNASAKPPGGHYEQPVQFLYFHAVELYLKSFLRLHGVEDRELKHAPYGHNLVSLLNEAEQRGLPVIRRVRSVCELAEQYRQHFDARYIKTGAKFAAATKRCHEACWKLRPIVERALHSAGVATHAFPALPVVHKGERHLTVAKAAKLFARRDKENSTKVRATRLGQ